MTAEDSQSQETGDAGPGDDAPAKHQPPQQRTRLFCKTGGVDADANANAFSCSHDSVVEDPDSPPVQKVWAFMSQTSFFIAIFSIFPLYESWSLSSC